MDKNIVSHILSNVTHGRGYVYSLQYHIVFVTKYRKPVFTGEIEDAARNHLVDTCKQLSIDILAMELMPDHVHMLVSCKPQTCLSDAIKVLNAILPGGFSSATQSSKHHFGAGTYGTPRIS